MTPIRSVIARRGATLLRSPDIAPSLRQQLTKPNPLFRATLATTSALHHAIPSPAPQSPATASPQLKTLHEKVSSAAPWLRDICPCPDCVSASSGQKTFSTAAIPPNIQPASIALSPAGDLTVRWKNDIPSPSNQEHISFYPSTYLSQVRLRAPSPSPIPNEGFTVPDRAIPPIPWNTKTISGALRKFTFKDWMHDDEIVHQGVLDLEALGLLFLKDVPKSLSSVSEIASRIANIQETFYGRTWNVVSKPEAENVAYTNVYLGLHQDMLYIREPPRIQFLHCMENSCEGGESLFSDCTRAAVELLSDPECESFIEPLSQYQVRYHYQKHPFTYRQSRPVLDIPPTWRTELQQNNHSNVKVWWSPPFQAPNPPRVTDPDSQLHNLWQRGVRRFDELLNDETGMYECKLGPGDCVLFDNRRVLHARRAFDTSSGTRHLHGTYVSDEDFHARVESVPGDVVERYRVERGLGRVPALDDGLGVYPSVLEHLMGSS